MKVFGTTTTRGPTRAEGVRATGQKNSFLPLQPIGADGNKTEREREKGKVLYYFSKELLYSTCW